MSDFTPVELVKGDIEFTAHTPTQLCNALYGGGFKRKPVAAAVEPVADAPEPVAEPDVVAPIDIPETDDKPTGSRRRRTSTPEETA